MYPVCLRIWAQLVGFRAVEKVDITGDATADVPYYKRISVCQLLTPLEGDELASRLHRSSAYRWRRTALASPSDTSGPTDKRPVLIQSCRTSSVRKAMFLAPTRSACKVYWHCWQTNSRPCSGRLAFAVQPQRGHCWL